MGSLAILNQSTVTTPWSTSKQDAFTAQLDPKLLQGVHLLMPDSLRNAIGAVPADPATLIPNIIQAGDAAARAAAGIPAGDGTGHASGSTFDKFRAAAGADVGAAGSTPPTGAIPEVNDKARAAQQLAAQADRAATLAEQKADASTQRYVDHPTQDGVIDYSLDRYDAMAARTQANEAKKMPSLQGVGQALQTTAMRMPQKPVWQTTSQPPKQLRKKR